MDIKVPAAITAAKRAARLRENPARRCSGLFASLPASRVMFFALRCIIFYSAADFERAAVVLEGSGKPGDGQRCKQ
jgi:hypothetical protein